MPLLQLGPAVILLSRDRTFMTTKTAGTSTIECDILVAGMDDAKS